MTIYVLTIHRIVDGSPEYIHYGGTNPLALKRRGERMVAGMRQTGEENVTATVLPLQDLPL